MITIARTWSANAYSAKTNRPACRPEGARDRPLHRGTVLYPHPGRPWRRGDQGGAAGRRSVPRLGRLGGWALGVVQRAWPQQAVGGARPEARSRHGAEAGRAGRCAGGEPARRRPGAAEPEPRGAACGQSTPGDRAHLRLRPGRPLSRQAGVRRHRRGHGRHPPPHRASRPAVPTCRRRAAASRSATTWRGCMPPSACCQRCGNAMWQAPDAAGWWT